MTDRRRRLHRSVVEELSGGDGVLRTAIPSATDVERMAVERRALAEFAPSGRAGRAYAQLWEELRARLG
jgi:chromosome partitioning protein